MLLNACQLNGQVAIQGRYRHWEVIEQHYPCIWATRETMLPLTAQVADCMLLGRYFALAGFPFP